MVVPFSFGSYQRKVKCLIQIGDGNIKAVHFFGRAVTIGDTLQLRLNELCAFLLRVFRGSPEKIYDILRGHHDMDRHLTVLYGKDTFSVLGLVNVEHTSIRCEIRQIHAVRKYLRCRCIKSLRFIRCLFCSSLCSACRSLICGFSCCLLTTARGNRKRCQH